MDTSSLIVLVDDEQEMLDIYSAKLRNAGYTVFTASNGAECLRIAKEKHPALILLDVKMPIMDGAETFIKLLDDPQFKGIKVIFLTALSDPSRMTEADMLISKKIGAMGYIKKGIGLDEFVERIKKL